MKRALIFCGVLFAIFGFSKETQAQVLVYEIDFSGAEGINFHTFEGGYVVAPLLGGAASFLLTSTEEGRTFTESTEGGKLFTAVSGGGDRKAVISARTGGGTAEGQMVALGDLNDSIKVNSPTVTLTAKVAKTLTGALVSADDESGATEPAINGSLGSAGVADVKMELDETQTNRANKGGLTLAQTIEQLKIELERQGFTDGDAVVAPVEPPATQ